MTKGILKSIKFRDKLCKDMKCHAPNTPMNDQFIRNLLTYTKILKASISLAKKTYYEACFN